MTGIANVSVALTRAELDLLLSLLGPVAADAWLFGSRVTGAAQRFSDVDVCILRPTTPDLMAAIPAARTACEESRFPYHVDISRFDDLPPNLQETVRRLGVKLSLAVPTGEH